MTLMPIEQETVIIYNQKEQTAECMTYDPRMIRRLDDLCGKSEDITLIREGDGFKEYKFPKRWIKVSAPKQMSEEQRAKLAENMRRLRQQQLEGENADEMA